MYKSFAYQIPPQCVAKPLGFTCRSFSEHDLASKCCVWLEGDVYSGKTSVSQHFFVCNLMLPLNSKNTTEAYLVEGVNFFFAKLTGSTFLSIVQGRL